MKKEMECIVCPNGCLLEVELSGDSEITVDEIAGHHCDKGPMWAEQEIVRPVRNISSSIPVSGGDFPLVSVRTDAPIPVKSIMDVMKIVKTAKAVAPVSIGDIMIARPAGTDCNLIATRNVKAC